MSPERHRDDVQATNLNVDTQATLHIDDDVQATHHIHDDDGLDALGLAAAAATTGPGTVTRRFGPGVPAEPAKIALLEKQIRRVKLRRWRWITFVILLALLIGIVAWLLWLWLQPNVKVMGVRTSQPTSLIGCNTTEEISAAILTDGRAGDVSYRWVRNDGQTSEVQRVQLSRGQREVTVVLRWRFEGAGHYDAVARLEVLSPQTASGEVSFTYACTAG